MRFRTFVLPLLVLSFFFALASAALADAPPSGPVQLKTVTFESPADTLQTDPASALATYTGPNWDRIPNRHAGGSYGFWCAGTSPGSWGIGGGYPAGTHGIAYLATPDTSAWVDSQVQFAYSEPSVRSNEFTQPFVVSWSSLSPTDSTPAGEGYKNQFLEHTAAGAFRTVSLDRGKLIDGGTVGLGAGWLRFQFLSSQNSQGSGEGVTLDDIVVSGYEFNEPRNVSALRDHADHNLVTLHWDKPLARDGVSIDSRDIYYRVWQRDVAANTWSEVTSSTARVHSTTCTATTDSTRSYQYVVQAWEQASTSSWGKLSTTANVGPAIVRFSALSASPALVAYNGVSRLTATLLDEVGAPLSGAKAGIVVHRKYAGGAWTVVSAIVSEATSGTYVVSVPSAMNATYYLTYSLSGAASPNVTVSARAYLSMPGAPKSVKHAKTFTVTGKVSRVPVTRTVTLRAYRKEGSKYVLRASTTVKVKAGSGTVSFKKTWSLRLKGTYHIVSYVSDSRSAATTSAYRTVVVK